METIGAELTLVEQGTVEIELPFDEKLTQQHGFLHAGVISAALDPAGTYAAYSVIDPDASILTIEFKVNLLSPGRGERFLFRGEVTEARHDDHRLRRARLRHPLGRAGQADRLDDRHDDGHPRTRGYRRMKVEMKDVAGRKVLYVMAVDAEYGPHLQGTDRAADDRRRTGRGRSHADEDAGRPCLPKTLCLISSSRSVRRVRPSLNRPKSIRRHRSATATWTPRRSVSRKARRRFSTFPPSFRCRCAFPASRRPGFRPAPTSSPAPPMTASTPTWWKWRPIAVLRACQSFGVPLIALRGISDGKAELKHVNDWTEYLACHRREARRRHRQA